jgi:hypothetical protein
MNSITKTGSANMKTSTSLSVQLCAGLLATWFAAAGAIAGTVPIGTFAGSKGGFYDVTESGSTAPDFTPPDPTFSDSTSLQLKFTPAAFARVETGSTSPISMDFHTSSILVPIRGAELINDPNFRGYSLASANLHLAGSYSLAAPFNVSAAQFMLAASFTAQVTHVDWRAWNTGNSLQANVEFTPSSKLITGPVQEFDNGTWTANATIDWSALRTAAGLSAGQHITGVAINMSTDLGAASMYGYSRVDVKNYNIDASIAPVAVPEPPTIILAGLGAAAAVGHGYRRRKLRQRDAEGSDDEWNAEEGAIALTA